MLEPRITRSTLFALLATSLLAACGGGEDGAEPTPTADSAGYTQVIAFGDSLSDAGTYNPTTADSDPTNDVPIGLQFTTKPGGTWATFAAQSLGLPLTPVRQVNFGVVGRGGVVFTVGGTDYAEGGATISVDAPNNGVQVTTIPGAGTVNVQNATARSITSQISAHLATNPQFGSTQLVFIQGGANDFFAFLRQVAGNPSLGANAPGVISTATTAMVTQIQRLRAAGAQHIVYANLPDLGATPQFRGTPLAGLATTLATNYNTAVSSALAGSGVRIFDTQGLIAKVIANPAQYGFSNVTTPACTSTTTPGDASTLSALICTASTLVASGADQSYLFADGVHPTARAHLVWGNLAAELARQK